MQYFIRRADTKDIDDLSNLFVDFIGKDSDKDKMEEQLRRINENSNYYVAVAEGYAVGLEWKAEMLIQRIPLRG
ncbi:hypothetical protein D3C78_723980 [compost metagenome]